MNKSWDSVLPNWKPSTSGSFVIRLIRDHKKSRGVVLGNDRSEIHLQKQERGITTSYTHTAFYRKV
jgi:hypothetical protein